MYTRNFFGVLGSIFSLYGSSLSPKEVYSRKNERAAHAFLLFCSSGTMYLEHNQDRNPSSQKVTVDFSAVVRNFLHLISTAKQHLSPQIHNAANLIVLLARPI